MSKIKDKKQEGKLYRWLIARKALGGNWLFIAVGLGILNGCLIFFQAMLVAKIVHQAVIDGVMLNQQAWMIWLLLILFCIRAVVLWLLERVSFELGSEIRLSIRSELLDRIYHPGPIWLITAREGQWTTALIEQTEHLQIFYARYLPQMTIALVIPVLYALFILPFSWVVSFIFLLTAPLIPLFMILLGSRTAKVSRHYFKELSRLSAYFLDRLQGLPTLRWFYCSKQEHLRLAAATENYRLRTLQVLRLAFLSSTVLEFFAAISIAMTAVYMGMSQLGYISIGVPVGNYSLFSGLFLLMLAPEFYQPLKDLGRYYHARSEAIGAAESLVALLDKKMTAQPEAKAICSNKNAMFLELKNVTVRSPKTDMVLLDNISFKIRAAEHCLVVGESGAGKTTLIMTLLGMMDYSGEILLNGEPVSHWQSDSWRRQIAWLGQNPYLLYGSVLENVSLGLGFVDKAKVKQALTAAGACSFVNRLPYGLQTCIGENGAQLSVGQNQRIALARLLLREAQLILLDEPMASLDLESANYIKEAINAYSHGRTMINANHDLALTHQCDRILVLSNGQLVEQGDMHALLNRKRHFYKLWQLQNVGTT